MAADLVLPPEIRAQSYVQNCVDSRGRFISQGPSVVSNSDLMSQCDSRGQPCLKRHQFCVRCLMFVSPIVSVSSTGFTENTSSSSHLPFIDDVLAAAFAHNAVPMATEDGSHRNAEADVLSQQQFLSRHHLIGHELGLPAIGCVRSVDIGASAGLREGRIRMARFVSVSTNSRPSSRNRGSAWSDARTNTRWQR